MPELTECMYAHQQVCIPPTFPYILRQYAKAAIRSQPTDLLKWSTAYFRCLALSLPAPVKPRLEYPITKTHCGLTPGWLKTLLKQFAGYQTVSWPLLVDRWQGACLDMHGLVEIIMTAGFLDPAEIPWYRFIAVAAGFLMPNLTQTMILICELLTEEPEGGSSMISAGTFNDLYQFLAELDCSAERQVRNFYYTESNLDLTKREPEPISETMITEEIEEERSKVSVETEQEIEKIPEKISTELQQYLYEIPCYGEGGSFEGEFGAERMVPGAEGDMTADQLAAIQNEDSNLMIPPQLGDRDSCFVLLDSDDQAERETPTLKEESSEESTISTEISTKSKSTVTAETIGPTREPSIKKIVSHTGETLTASSEGSGPEGFSILVLPIVPGIGPIVPPDMVKAVLKYVLEMSLIQQGMFMPRNIRHFTCPPLREMEQN